MGRLLQQYTITVPAGTAKATPVTRSIAVGIATVERIRWRVPPGPRGNLGWYLAMGGVQVLPNGQGNYIIADDENDEWVLTDLPDEGEWQLVGYNTGTFDHAVYLSFVTTPLQDAAGRGAPLVVAPANLSP